MTTLVSFVLVIGILILIHEFGHFMVARWCGVGVERFSIGFGPVLVRWRGKETEYCLSAVPMGGYVKMVGEENPLEGGGGPVFDPGKAFAMKPLWARFLIVFAGPGMNFVLAAVIFTIVFATVGRPVWPALIGRVAEGGPAAAAGLKTGDVVTAVDGRPVSHWEDLERAIAGSGGRALRLAVRRDGRETPATVTPRRTVVRDPIFREPRDAWELGAGSQLTPQIGSVNPGSPADKAGLRAGDLVLGVAGQPVFSPDELMQSIQKRAGQTFELTVERDGAPRTLAVTATAVKEKGPTGQEQEIGRIGVGIVTRVVRYEAYNPVVAVWYGGVRTWDMTALTAKGLWKIVSRQIDSSNIGGPIQIAAEAGRQAKEGAASLALFTAIISVNLALLNLLPVPMLDGGHLFFFVIEAVMGRPLSLKKREAAQQLGFVLLMLLMVFALYNDLVRIDAFKIFR
ncbi:MAG: RIP metalloprotease RseP [Candidatus Rokubacteria bacterium]|nr:RIP metalloprotease RseP [Candidatus Rokubacteria bacterium]MBI2155801.1 RIP metalloprotease RseP [Candidatus Rokubacteria bacterium]